MATALDPALKDKHFQNWLKGAFVILFGTEALKEFVENEIIEFHKYVMHVVSKQTGLSPATCNTCTTANMLSCPTEGFCNRRKRCNAHDQTSKAPNKPCPNGICHVIKHEVCHDHRFANPFWQNTDAQKWCSDAFQLAKCYMPDGYLDKTTPAEIDFNGLISVVINSKRFQGKFSAKLDVEPNVCSRTRDICRKFRHSPDFLLSDVDLAKCFDAFLDLLHDSAYLLHNVKVQEIVQKIKELKNITVVIQTGNITRDTLKTQTDAAQEIQELFRNYQLEVNSCINAIQTIGTEALDECQSLLKEVQESTQATQQQHTKITEDLLKGQRPLDDRYYRSSTFIDDVLPETTIPDCKSGTTLKTGDCIAVYGDENTFILSTLSGFINHPHYGLCGFTFNYPHSTDSEVFLCRKRKKGEPEYIKVGRLVKRFDAICGLLVFQVHIAGLLFCVFPQVDDPLHFKIKFPIGISTGNYGRTVIKYGAATAITEGKIVSSEFCQIERPLWTELFLIATSNTRKSNSTFAKNGDIGSIVLMEGYNTEANCVGALLGMLHCNNFVIYPIGSILTAMNVVSLTWVETYANPNGIIRFDIKTYCLEQCVERIRKLEELIRKEQKITNKIQPFVLTEKR